MEPREEVTMSGVIRLKKTEQQDDGSNEPSTSYAQLKQCKFPLTEKGPSDMKCKLNKNNDLEYEEDPYLSAYNIEKNDYLSSLRLVETIELSDSDDESAKLLSSKLKLLGKGGKSKKNYKHQKAIYESNASEPLLEVYEIYDSDDEAHASGSSTGKR